MSNGAICVKLNRDGTARVFVGETEIPVNRLYQITLDLTAGDLPVVNLQYKPESFHLESENDD